MDRGAGKLMMKCYSHVSISCSGEEVEPTYEYVNMWRRINGKQVYQRELHAFCSKCHCNLTLQHEFVEEVKKIRADAVKTI